MAAPPHRWRSLAVPVALALPVAAIDLAAKAWAIEQLAGRPPLWLARPWLRLELAINPGTAFGLLGTSPATIPVLLGLAVIAYLLWLAARRPVAGRTITAGLALMLGGAAGNLVDRFRPPVDDGSLWTEPVRGVVDFIAVGSWPAFNLADVALVVGAALLLSTMALRRPSPAG